MKHAIISKFDKLIVALLSLFWLLTSCEPETPPPAYGPMPTPEYGIPAATYEP